MSSYLAGCRNAVVERLAGGETYARECTVRGVYTDTVESAINRTADCDVLCRVVATDEPDFIELPASRGTTRVLIPVEIVVAGAVTSKNAEDIDELLEVVEQLRDRLWAREARLLLHESDEYRFVRVELNPITDPTTIQERHYAIFSMTAYYMHERHRAAT